MRRSGRLLFIVLLSSLLYACASTTPKSVPLNAALYTLETELYKCGVANVSDLKSFTAMAQAYQCFYKTDNPVIPVLTKEIALTLTGSFQETVSGSGGAVTAVPTLGFTVGVTAQQQQQIALPLAHVPLKSIWLIYLQQNLQSFANVPKNADDYTTKTTNAAITEIINKAEDIKTISDNLSECYLHNCTPDICKNAKPGHFVTPGVLAPYKMQ